MHSLTELMRDGESALISRVIHYAKKTGYIKYTPTEENVWRSSVRGLSEGLVSALTTSPQIPELSPDLDFTHDRITSFGVEQAKKHRSRGVTLEQFLGLMKYFRQSYHDLIDDNHPVGKVTRWEHAFVERYFDRIELGFISEWERCAAELNSHHETMLLARNNELSRTNIQLKQEVIERKRAEQLIKKLNISLERRVEVRTLQLNRINEQNNFKLKELLILNHLSSLNLSKVRLNRLTVIILESLISNAPLFFDRAMLFLLNERTQTLQGMIGVIRKNDASSIIADDSQLHPPFSETEARGDSDLFLNNELRSCRIELKKGKGIFYRAVNENRVIQIRTAQSLNNEASDLFSRLNVGSSALMPLMGKNGIFGVVVVDNSASLKDVSRNDLKFLRLFSNHAGIAIENLMLYTSLEDTNRRLQETQEQLVHGARLATIGEMAASIAHELKGPMVAIGGFARRLARKIPQESIEAEYVATIIEEEQRLESMLNDVLSFSKKTTVCYESCSITEIVESALSILGHLFDKNSIILSKSFPRNEIILYADCQQLKQVFINLFHNAVDVMTDGGVLRVSVTTSRLGRERAVAIKISDTGGGVPDSMRNSIFTPFFTTKSSGTGLGLPIANRIVSNHHGKLKVRNNSTVGAEFTVLLPWQEQI